MRFSGYFAWLFWLFAHVYFLIGFRNRLVVLLDWAWAYWSFARYARVVTGIAGMQPPTKNHTYQDQLLMKPLRNPETRHVVSSRP